MESLQAHARTRMDGWTDRPVTLRPRGLLPGDAGCAAFFGSTVGVGVVIAAAAAPAPTSAAGVVVNAVVAPVGEGGSGVGRGRRAAVPVGPEVVVLVAYEEQRPVAVALLLVAIHAAAGLASGPRRSIDFDPIVLHTIYDREKESRYTRHDGIDQRDSVDRSPPRSGTNCLMEPATFVVWSRSGTRTSKRERDEHGAGGRER